MNQSFASLGLIDPLLKAIDELNYREPTPVQQKSIPSLLEGKDMLAAAQTGTGKTAAYSLPIIQKIAESGVRAKPKEVTALILAPTRELAAQIHENITAYSKYLDIRSALVFGGVNLKPQTAALARGVDILIATPGRLLDHLGQKHVSLSAVKFLVLDEADRMLDMGFIHDIRKLIKLIPENRQSLLFSATFSPEIRKLADSLLNSPVSVEISPNKESALIEQQAYAVPKNRKRELLRDLIVDEKWSQVLVFTRMKHAANRLCQQLIKDGLTDAFHNYHMGITAENICEQWGLTREELDEFAAWSQNKCEKAMAEGKFKDEIVPVEVKKKKETILVDTDEGPRKGITKEGLAKLRPAFKKDGMVTAGNASGINDGAAALIVMSEEKAKELGVTPMATWIGGELAGCDPAIMGIGPVYSTRKVMKKLGMEIGDFDLIEANEAFAAQSVAVGKDLGFDLSKLNVNGGAIALGHPVGCSGARILVSLLYEMQKEDVHTGLATLCVGGGMGCSAVVKRD